jgi:tetratricopeptide (TPR) repeat protein
VAAFEDAAVRAPEDAGLRAALGASYMQVGRFEEAAAAYRHAIRRGLQHDPDVHFNLAVVFDKLTNYEEAAQTYAMVVRLKHDHAEAHRRLGAALANMARYREAIDAYLLAVRFNFNDVALRFELGTCYLNMGNREGAMEQYRALVTMDPLFSERLLRMIQGV